jgi:hypothetical protein
MMDPYKKQKNEWIKRHETARNAGDISDFRGPTPSLCTNIQVNNTAEKVDS